MLWSDADQTYVGICYEFLSLSWLAPAATAQDTLTGIRRLVAAVVADLTANGEPLPGGPHG